MTRRASFPRRQARTLGALLAGALFASPFAAQAPDAPVLDPGDTPQRLRALDYTAPFFPGATYDDGVPTPESLLGFPVGRRAATHAEIERCLAAWADASDRATLVEYARTHEGRALYYLVVTSPANHARIDEIKRGLEKLADPRSAARSDNLDELARTLPAVAWLAYAIHGDEMSGSDAALAVAYHLVAGTDEATLDALDALVVVIDPLMNPDGRERFIKQIREPFVKVNVLTPTDYVGTIMELCQEKRGEHQGMQYISADRVQLVIEASADIAPERRGHRVRDGVDERHDVVG